MKYISAAQAAEGWGVSARRVRMWCSEGQIPDSRFVGSTWQIPANAEKPLDKRTKVGKTNRVTKEHIAHFYNPDFLQQIPEAQITEDDRTLAAVQQLWFEGNLDEAYQCIRSYCGKCQDEAYLLFGLHIYFNIAQALGKTDERRELYQRLRKLLLTGRYPVTTAYMGLALKTHLIDLFNVDIPYDAMPLLLYVSFCREIADGMRAKTPPNEDRMELICKSIEATACDSFSASTHALLAAYYRMQRNPEMYALHKQCALDIMLPRRFYLFLAEHSYWVDWELEKYLDETTRRSIETLAERFADNMVKNNYGKCFKHDDEFHSYQMLKIAFALASGNTSKEICDRLGISMYTLKRYISRLYACSGTCNRRDFTAFLLDKVDEM